MVGRDLAWRGLTRAAYVHVSLVAIGLALLPGSSLGARALQPEGSGGASTEVSKAARDAREIPGTMVKALDDAVLAPLPIVRQAPATFPKLPGTIRRHLEQHGYAIPQPYGRRQANVVRGQFERRGQSDWAVLCSKGGVSRLLIFWGGSTARVDSLASAADEEFMQGVEPGQMGYSRAITAVSPAVMRGFYEEWDRGTPPVPLTHDGIDDSFVEKSSVVHYWHQGGWLRLAGAD